MKCPFRKCVIKTQYIDNTPEANHQEDVEAYFGECYEEKCMAYIDQRCSMVEKGK